MPLGNLDRYITIQTFSTSKDSYGEPVKTWSTYKSVYAEKIHINQTSDNESVIQDQIVNKQRVQWRVRYDSGITNKMRISYGSEYYDIQDLQEEGRERFLLINTYKTDG